MDIKNDFKRCISDEKDVPSNGANYPVYSHTSRVDINQVVFNMMCALHVIVYIISSIEEAERPQKESTYFFIDTDD